MVVADAFDNELPVFSRPFTSQWWFTPFEGSLPTTSASTMIMENFPVSVMDELAGVRLTVGVGADWSLVNGWPGVMSPTPAKLATRTALGSKDDSKEGTISAWVK